MIEYTLEEVQELSALRRGDQLAVRRNKIGIDYLHFGIFLGAVKGVAEVSSRGIRIVDLFKFKRDSQLLSVVYPSCQCLDSEEVAQRAENFVRNPKHWGVFHLVTNNCEHFCTYCKTGIAFSKQVKDIDAMGSRVAGAVLLTFTSPLTSSKQHTPRNDGKFGDETGFDLD